MAEITPDVVADILWAEVPVYYHDGVGWSYETESDGNVLKVAITQVTDDDRESEDGPRHFRAVVVEGDGPVVVASPELLAAARALYRVHVAAGSLPADQAAHVRYEVEAALYALTPDQVAVLAGDEQAGGVPDPVCWCEHVHNGVGMQRVLPIAGCPAHDPEGESRVAEAAQAEQDDDEPLDETCGDCMFGRCHGDGPCGCARHDASVEAGR